MLECQELLDPAREVLVRHGEGRISCYAKADWNEDESQPSALPS